MQFLDRARGHLDFDFVLQYSWAPSNVVNHKHCKSGGINFGHILLNAYFCYFTVVHFIYRCSRREKSITTSHGVSICLTPVRSIDAYMRDKMLEAIEIDKVSERELPPPGEAETRADVRGLVLKLFRHCRSVNARVIL